MTGRPGPAIRRVGVELEAFAPLMGRIVAFLNQHGAALNRWTRHHPIPLPFDGHAYRRRTRTRTRRNR